MTAPIDYDDEANVIPLHRRPSQAPRLFPTEVAPDGAEGEVLEGELLDLEEYQRRTAVEVVRDIIADDRVRIAGRQVAFAALGARTVARRVWDARSVSRYERMMRAAEAVGDMGALMEWETRTAAYRRDRHQRRMDLAEMPARALGVLPKATVGAVAGLGALGALLAIATEDVTKVVAPYIAVAEVVEFGVNVASAVWLPALLLSPVLLALALWSVGRKTADGADLGWLATAAEADVDIEIDETTIARALEALRISQITAYFKQGLPLQYLTTARRDGRGTHAVLRLPAGVTAEQITARRAALATGLYRAANEVWPSTGSEAGILDLWVADKGALAEGAGPYPLLDEGTVDVFKGVPFGRTLRGDAVTAPIYGRNTIVGGMPDQGKSSAARVIVAGAMLDPIAELRIWVPDSNYDFESFRPRCSRYVMGAEPEKIEQILNDLRELHAEIQTRGELLVKHQEPEVTRALAERGIGLHPIVALLEEAHVAINDGEHGAEIGHLLTEITKLGRKRAIHLIVSTQAPTKDSMPRGVTRNCTNGVAFAVGDHHANDALLGQGAYAGGHRATELIPGVDKGTALVKGVSGQRSEMVQVYFLSVRKGEDQVVPLVERSLAEIKRKGRALPGTPRTEIERRDLLDDLDDVIGAERVRLADIPALLRDLAPHWAAYRAMTAKTLWDELTAAGVRVTNAKNIPRLDPADLRARIGELSTEDLDDNG